MSAPAPELRFPVRCPLRIIFEGDGETIRLAAQAVLGEYLMTEQWVPGRSSAGGKYGTLAVTVSMPDRATLEALPRRLASIPGVRMVL